MERAIVRSLPHASKQRPIALAHPVISGYNGSSSARNALAYAARTLTGIEAM